MSSQLYAHAPRLPDFARAESLDLRALLPGSGPLEVEVGSGRGGFIFERLASAEVRIIGFEIRRKWAARVDARLERAGLRQRARVFAEDIRQVLPHLTPASLDVVYVHFPDPWWKKRHWKRLVIAVPFVEQVAGALKPGGELFVQTDVEERAQAYEHLILVSQHFVPAGLTARIDTNPYGARSPRERRAEQDRLPVYRLRWRRTEEAL